MRLLLSLCHAGPMHAPHRLHALQHVPHSGSTPTVVASVGVLPGLVGPGLSQEEFTSTPHARLAAVALGNVIEAGWECVAMQPAAVCL